MTVPLVVRQTLRPDAADAVRDLVSDALADRRGDGVDGLLPVAGVCTVSLFLHPGDPPSLTWYVEVADGDAPPWTDAAGTIRRASPLFAAGLDEYLADQSGTRVDGSERGNATRVVHARHPRRPGSVEARTHRDPAPTGVEPGATGAMAGDAAADGGPTPVDVVLLRVGIRRGPGEWFARAFGRFAAALDDDGWLEGKFAEWSEPVLEDEEMFTETIYLERTDDRYAYLWYMEAESMAQVLDAYFETDNPVARVSEAVLDRLLVDPARVFESPVETAGFELLAHAADPERP